MACLQRDVWDCLIPAAVREEISLPKKRKQTYRRFEPIYDDNSTLATDDDDNTRVSNGDSASISQLSSPHPTVDPGYEGFWKSMLSAFFENEGSIKDLGPLPPKAFFEIHEIPKAPTWSERDVDNLWLPSAPSLAYDEYAVLDE